MNEVEVKVVCYPWGDTIVKVREDDVLARCWRTLAKIAAAAVWGVPFTDVASRAKVGLRPEDRDRLAEEYRRKQMKEEMT